MTIVKRLVKGSALTQVELDGNFTDYEVHKSDTTNPHGVTKAQVGLSNADNTSDVNKPVSTAQQTAIDTAFSGVAVRLAAPVADLAALKAINTTSSTTWPDKIMILAETIGQYRLDRDSSATGNDDGVVQPTTGIGRWIKLNVAGTAAFSTLSGDPDDNAALVVKFANYVTKEAFITLADGSTVTWDNLNKQSPLAKVTMGSTARTLVMPNVKSGASGTLKIITSTSSAITLTFDTNYTNKVQNVALNTFTFPAATGKEYFLYYIADGPLLEWVIVDGTGSGLPTGTSGQIIVYNAGGVGTAVAMSGDCTISNTGVITIGANKVTLAMLATIATGKVLGNLTGSTAPPSVIDVQEQIVTDSTQQMALNTESGWSGGTKTISGILAGQTWEGTNLTDGLVYRYLSVTNGIATRIVIGQATDISTLPTITQSLSESFADVGNTTTSETDLSSLTLAAAPTKGNLGTNGDCLIGEFSGTFLGNATATRQLRFKMGGTTMFDSTALVTASTTRWRLSFKIIRVSSTVVRWDIMYISGMTILLDGGDVTGLTLSGSNILKLTGQAGATGAATNDIVLKSSQIRFIPKSV